MHTIKPSRNSAFTKFESKRFSDTLFEEDSKSTAEGNSGLRFRNLEMMFQGQQEAKHEEKPRRKEERKL